MTDIPMAEPRLVQRFCGGWLAFSTRSNDLQIGVTAATAEEARTKFIATVEQWRGMLASPAYAKGCE